ncbi:MAG: dockerin type I repeat-containing protein, partial [Oscillospiraceae bacterium]|nr:dockerin type I repeat-containing protein [Oscillospiraceae bacterium]
NEELSRETKAIEKLPHTPVVDAAVDPTCTESGLTAGEHCSVCGEILTAQQEVPATGHDWKFVDFSWTKTDDGYTAVANFKCKNNAAHTQPVDAAVTSAVDETTGDTIYTATATFEDENYTDTYTVAASGSTVTVEDMTNGAATVSGDIVIGENTLSGATTFTVNCEDACLVAWTADGESYTRLKGTADENSCTFTIDVAQDMSIVIILKGDTSLDGEVKNQDATMAKAASLNKTTLDVLQEMAADVTGDGVLKNQDVTQLKAFILGKAPLQWDT